MEKIKKIIEIIVLIILIPILIISVTLIVKSYTNKDEVPGILGKYPLIVLSGSMENTIMTGDLILVNEVDTSSLQKDDVIAFFTDANRDKVITHRIIEVKEENGEKKFVTKGDNNNSIDQDTVPEELVIGEYNGIRFAGLGNAAMFLQTTTGVIIVISIPILIIIVSQYFDNRRDKKELEKLKKEKSSKN